jgi:hypothetical protein
VKYIIQNEGFDFLHFFEDCLKFDARLHAHTIVFLKNTLEESTLPQKQGL